MFQSKPAQSQSFRADINGLRAWAVVAVILYHFGVPGFGGGFVGVDVFFVISGFLMTGIVVKGLERGEFSIFSFYMARARRIVPALVGLCATLLVLGWFLLLPPDYKVLSTHSIYSLSFLSNIEYWLEAGYFDIVSHEKWLLHTWSLSVEWQFYLLLPIVLSVVWHFNPTRPALIWMVSIALVASFAASVFFTRSSPNAAFFLLHTRAWEMLGGGLLFLLRWSPALPAVFTKPVEKIGLFLILFSIASFDRGSAWPGWLATVPVLGAMMVIVSNSRSVWTDNLAAQWIGDRSYSLYLWHWPVYVALVYLELGNEALAIACGILVTFLIGHLSYVWVEGPLRRLLNRANFSFAAKTLAVATLVVSLPALAVWGKKGVPGRFNSVIENAAAQADNINPRRAECHTFAGRTSNSCIYGGNDWRVIGLGDSHLSAMISGLAAAGGIEGAGVVQWSYSGCAFVPGMKKLPTVNANLGDGYQCEQFISWAKDRLQTLPDDIPVVIANRYALAAFGYNESRHQVGKPQVYFSKQYEESTPEFLREFAEHITASACEIAKSRAVYMVRPIPELGVDVPKILSRRMALGVAGDISIPLKAYQERNAWVWLAQDAARDRCGVKILDAVSYLCRDGRCYGSSAQQPLYHDDNHLSEFGNKLLVPMFAEVYKEMLPRGR